MVDEATALFGRRVEGHCQRAEADAVKHKRDVQAAVQRAMDEALGVAADRAERAAARPRRHYRYEMGADGLPRPVPVESEVSDGD